MKKVKCLKGSALPGLEEYALSLYAYRPSHLPRLNEPFTCSDGMTVLSPNEDSVQCSTAIIDARIYGPDGVGFLCLMHESAQLMDLALNSGQNIYEASQPWAKSATAAGFLMPISMWRRKVPFRFRPTESVKGRSTHAKGREQEHLLAALLKPQLIEQINEVLFPEKLYVASVGERGIDFRSNNANPFYLPATSCKCDKYLSTWEIFLEFAERSLSAEERTAQKAWKESHS